MSYFNQQDSQCTAHWGIWGNRKKMEGDFLRLQARNQELEKTNKTLREVIAKMESGDVNYHIKKGTIFTSYIDNVISKNPGKGYGFIGNKYFCNQNVKCDFNKLKKGDLVKYKIIKMNDKQCHVEVLENETQTQKKQKELEKFINEVNPFEDATASFKNKSKILEEKSSPKKFKMFHPGQTGQNI